MQETTDERRTTVTHDEVSGPRSADDAAPPAPAAERGSEATRTALEAAAVELIERDGILAGLNLREVADRAGVNRGNIYHYFGSRRDLLRSALASNFSWVTPWLAEGRSSALLERKLRVFRKMPTSRVAVLALLAIDGDDSADPLPDLENSIADLERDREIGDIAEGHDLAAIQVAFQSLTQGYRLFRTQYARRLEIDPELLDERVEETLATWLSSLSSPPDPTGNGGGE